MKIIEYHRHSIPGDGVHLIQAGVDLARKTGNSMTSFNYVITSPKERAFEIAIAMGYAVNDINEGSSTYGEDLEGEFDYDTLIFPKIKKLLSRQSHTLEFAKKQVNFLLTLAQTINDGEKLLLISHGGVIDIPLVFMFLNEDLTTWGGLFECCEGYRITIEENQFINYEILRV